MGIRGTEVWRDSAYSPARKELHLFGVCVVSLWMGVSSPCGLNSLHPYLLRSVKTNWDKAGAERTQRESPRSFPALFGRRWGMTAWGRTEGPFSSCCSNDDWGQRQAPQKRKDRRIIWDSEWFLLLKGMLLTSSLPGYMQRWDNSSGKMLRNRTTSTSKAYYILLFSVFSLGKVRNLFCRMSLK